MILEVNTFEETQYTKDSKFRDIKKKDLGNDFERLKDQKNVLEIS